MPTELKPQAAKSSNDLPPLTDDARAVLKWLRHRAREASEFAGVDDTAGEAIERLAITEWGDAARDLFDNSGENMLTDEGDSGDADPLDIDKLNKGLPAGDKWRAEEPGIAMLSLQKPGDERVPLLTAMSLARGNAQQKAQNRYLSKNLHLVALPTREQVAEMLQRNAPGSKVHRLALHCHTHDLTEEGRQNRNPTPAEKAEADKLIDRAFGKR